MKLMRITLLCLFLSSPAWADEIKVSVAISLRETVTDLARAYKAGGGDDVSFTFGASGQLVAQIREGADVDAFISAEGKQVDDLTKAGLAVTETQRDVVGNTLVLVVPAAEKDAPASFAALADANCKKVAIGDPKSVPAGDYAMQTLKSLGIADKVSDRLVYGANVRQVLTYVERGEVPAGLVYATDARASSHKVKVVAVADERTHEPIIYRAVVIKASKKQQAALKFLDFLNSTAARKVFKEKGFSEAPPTTAPAK
jgi:molybdate transport system substrate-binding protein